MSADWANDPKVTIHERDEGQWFAYLGTEMDGPHEDAEEARAALPVTNPARGAYCGDGLYGDHDEKHDEFLATHYLGQGKWWTRHDLHGGPHDEDGVTIPQHSNNLGDWCPFSGQRTYPGALSCPQNCRDSARVMDPHYSDGNYAD